jgi:hypothetical protein
MRPFVLPIALSLTSLSIASAGPGPLNGTENIPQLMGEATLVCKGEVVDAPQVVGSPNAPLPLQTATATVHVDRCFKGSRPKSEIVPIVFDGIFPSGGTSGGKTYVILRNGEYRLYFLKAEAGKYVLVDERFGQLSISRHLAADSENDSDPMHLLEKDLEAGLDDSDRNIVLENIRMLGNMRNLQSKTELISLIDSPDALVRTSVYQALLRLHDYSVLPAVEQWLIAQPAPPTDLILPNDSLFWMQYGLANEISKIRDPSYLPVMERLMMLPSQTMRVEILGGIRAIGSLQSAPTFLKALDDPDADIGFIAMQSLFELAGGGPIDWVPSFEQFRENRPYYAATCRAWWQANQIQKE